MDIFRKIVSWIADILYLSFARLYLYWGSSSGGCGCQKVVNPFFLSLIPIILNNVTKPKFNELDQDHIMTLRFP